MTIKEFMDKAKALDSKITTSNGMKYSELKEETTEIWSDDACRGYLITAAKLCDIQRENIEKMLDELRYVFSTYSVEEAEKISYNF